MATYLYWTKVYFREIFFAVLGYNLSISVKEIFAPFWIFFRFGNTFGNELCSLSFI